MLTFSFSQKLLLASLTLLSGSSAVDLAPGIPDRSPTLDVLPGFQIPPAGYGQVPFWWWTGDDLNEERLLWQLNELNEKGISGVQVNYSHTDSPGWPSDAKEPKIFTEDWWRFYSRVSEECAKFDMGISLSTYTLDWDNGADNLFYRLFYSKPELNAIELNKLPPVDIKAGETKILKIPENVISIRAYKISENILTPGGIDLLEYGVDGEISWEAPANSGNWQLWTFVADKKEGTLNSMLPGSGQTVVEGFYQKFQDHNKDQSANGLNFFFNDELEVGLGKYAWNSDFPAEFLKRKGYDLFSALPAMWVNMGDTTPKLLIDYADVRMSLIEERYFEPIYHWHADRNIIFGCDNHGRGLEPDAYGDYYRATRWYAAPGHDTPGGHADLIKGKVSSSIANLYQRPRVWLEGYHSLGWGATPENLMFATRENYLYGCTLLNLHGLYYSTHGSHWEWAPPCYHFRMPYWDHMDTFLQYFDRLSYIMSQGHHVCDIALYYPNTPYEAENGGEEAKESAFKTAKALMAAGINFDFIDHQSVERAVVKGDRLIVENANASYRTIIFPNMNAARWNNLTKAEEFRISGGQVIAIGHPPTISDRAGANDSTLTNLTNTLFSGRNVYADAEEAIEIIKHSYTQDVQGLQGPVRAYHRKTGFRDVYMVMDAKPGDIVEFRAKGKAELWDAWSGETTPLEIVKTTELTSQVKLPLEEYEAQVVVFTPDEAHVNPTNKALGTNTTKELPNTDWTISFSPTMDNRWGDFRLPVTEHNKTISLEARTFDWIRTDATSPANLPQEGWVKQQHGHGPQLHLTDGDGNNSLYEFSWRMGNKDDAGHQGFHGSKGAVSENFLRIGNFTYTGNGGIILDRKNPAKGPFTYTTNVVLDEAVYAKILVPTPSPYNAGYAAPNTVPVIAPSQIYINGELVENLKEPITLPRGVNTVKVIYNESGESHFVLKNEDLQVTLGVAPALSSKWVHGKEQYLAFDPFTETYGEHESSREWFRFHSAPGSSGITIPEASCCEIKAWYNGRPMKKESDGQFIITNPTSTSGEILLSYPSQNGTHGGALIPEPITIQTNGTGSIALGDWSQNDVLHYYSGGATYTKAFYLSQEEAETLNCIDLSDVVATAAVSINGEDAGVRVSPPWKYNLSGKLKAGQNTISVTVYNTLSNHYQTIPTMYKGDPKSGLLGPVKLSSQ